MFKISEDINLEKCLVEPELWVEKYADYLYNFAFTRLQDVELAKDLVQETFLAALEKLNSFQGNSTEKTWLSAILKYKIIDAYRSRQKSNTRLQESNEIAVEKIFFRQSDGHWNVEDRPQEFMRGANFNMESKEFSNILTKCIHKLPQLWRNSFIMKFTDNETTDTICGALKISAANYWVIMHRAKLNLRSCLQKNWL